MRTVFVGASSLTVMTSRQLLKRGHEVIIIERNKEKINSLSEDLDCGFINGDGSKPAILKETGAKQTDILYCLTNDDQSNILASLVGRSLGFKRIVTKIEDPELEHICLELGLDHTIIPARTIGRYLSDMVEGQDPMEITTMIRDEARIFSLVLRKEDEARIEELDLPKQSRIVCVYRDSDFIVPDEGFKLKAEDEVVVITHKDNLDALNERWVKHDAV
jgi:trk system potassium uptake protein TrkA